MTHEFSKIPLLNGELKYCSHFLSGSEADHYFQVLQRCTQWRQEVLPLFGRQLPTPRMSAWYGDPLAVYRYSKVTFQPLPWFEELLQLKVKISQSIYHSLNSVLLNYYRDGQDSMSWHADDEPELGPNPVIASLSLGAVRTFQMHHKSNRAERFQIPLEHGSLLIMSGQTQHYWKHQLPKSKKIHLPRINGTFRCVIPQ